ncbi:hypothetical protein [Streptomyces sp. NPDC051001]
MTIEEIADDVATVSTRWLDGDPNDTRFVFDCKWWHRQEELRRR